MVGTGLTFAAGIGGAVGAIGGIGALAGALTGVELLQLVGKFSVVSFVLGVVFSGGLALLSRGRTLENLTYRGVSLVGAGGGLVYFVFLALTGGRAWSLSNAIGNFVLLLIMGSTAAAGTLLAARKARGTLSAGAAPPGIGEGMAGAVSADSHHATPVQSSTGPR
jgi:hypothetical protein